MAFITTTIREYVGESTDLKPIDSTIPDGSRWYELDTRTEWRFFRREWRPVRDVAKDGSGRTEALLSELINEVKQLRECVTLALS